MADANEELPNDLPGMWDHSDLSGGATDCEQKAVSDTNEAGDITDVAPDKTI